MQTPVGLLLAINDLYWPDLITGVWLVLVGSLGFSAHFCLARALSLADAIVVAPIDFVRLPLITAIGQRTLNKCAENKEMENVQIVKARPS